MLSEWWSDLRYRLRAIVRREGVERELDDELRFHLALETEKLVRLGHPRGEAERLARVAFGGVERIKEDSRDARGVHAVETLVQDLRYAWRGIVRRPGFAFGVVLTLALGIGVNGAMFGILDQLMLRPPAMLRDPDHVHRVLAYSSDRGTERREETFAYTRFLDLRRWTTAFSQTAAHANRTLAIGRGDDVTETRIGAVSVSYFDFFDARPLLGRFFVAGEDTVPAGAPVAVLSYGLWRARFGGRPDVLGTSIQVGPTLCTIVGVAPEGFVGVESGAAPALWIPITTAAAMRNIGDPTNYYSKYNWDWLEVMARRRAGRSIRDATLDLTRAAQLSYAAELALHPSRTPAEIARPQAEAVPILRSRGPDAGPEAKVLLWVGGVALIVLLIACANVGNLLLLHSLRRRREIAVRLALGVSRRRLIAQLLTEVITLSVLGGAVAVALAYWGRLLVGSLIQDAMAQPPASDPRSLGFVLLLSLTTGIATGVIPAIHAGRSDLATDLKAGAREGTHQRSRTRTALLTLQGALSVLLLVGAGLFVRSLQRVRSLRLGYDVDPVIYVSRTMRSVQLTDSAQVELGRQLLTAAQVAPGVQYASQALSVPFYSTESEGLYVSGIDSVDKLGRFTLQAASPDYFKTMGTRVLRGRSFTPGDAANAPLVVIVSENMARALWPGRDALGACLRVGRQDAPCTTVVGIAEDMRQSSLTAAPDFTYYLSSPQWRPAEAGLLLRVAGDPAAAAETVRRQLQRLMPGDSYVSAVPLRRIIDPRYRSWQSGATLFAAFGGLALVLAGVGLYSVIAYGVAHRAHELGVRIALGARRVQVVRLIVGEGLRLAATGVAIGTALSLVSAGLLKPVLYDQPPRDPVILAGVVCTLLLVAAFASAIPAIRASRLDPRTALSMD